MRVEKQYLFDTPDGRKTLADLFDGRSQLAMYHFMFAPEWERGLQELLVLGGELRSHPHPPRPP